MDFETMSMSDLILVKNYLNEVWGGDSGKTRGGDVAFARAGFILDKVMNELDKRILGEELVGELVSERTVIVEGDQPEAVNLDDFNK